MCTYVADAHGHGTQLSRWLLACLEEYAQNPDLKQTSDATQAQMPLTWQLRDINLCIHGDDYKLHGVTRPVLDEALFDFGCGVAGVVLVAFLTLKLAEKAAERFAPRRPVQQQAGRRDPNLWQAHGKDPFKSSHP